MPRIESLRINKLFWVAWTEDDYGNRRNVCCGWTDNHARKRVRRRLW